MTSGLVTSPCGHMQSGCRLCVCVCEDSSGGLLEQRCAELHGCLCTAAACLYSTKMEIGLAVSNLA